MESHENKIPVGVTYTQKWIFLSCSALECTHKHKLSSSLKENPYHTSSEILQEIHHSPDCGTQNRLNGPLWPPGSSVRSPGQVFLLKRKTPTNRVLHHSPKYTHLLRHTPKNRLGKNSNLLSQFNRRTEQTIFTHTRTHARTHVRKRERETNTTTARVSSFASENPNRRDSRSKLDWRCANWLASPHGRGICLGEVCGRIESLFVSRGAGHSFSRWVWKRNLGSLNLEKTSNFNTFILICIIL